jgi:hypothetical protein
MQAFRRNRYDKKAVGNMFYYRTPKMKQEYLQSKARDYMIEAQQGTAQGADPPPAVQQAKFGASGISSTFGAAAKAGAVGARPSSLTLKDLVSSDVQEIDDSITEGQKNNQHALMPDECAKGHVNLDAGKHVVTRGDDLETIKEYSFPNAPTAMTQEQVARTWQCNMVLAVMSEAFTDTEMFAMLGQLYPVGPVPCSIDLWEQALEYLWVANGHAEYSQGLCPQQRRTLNQSGYIAATRAVLFGNDKKKLESFPSLSAGGSSLKSSGPQQLTVPYSLAVHVDGEGTYERVVSFQNGIWLDLPRILPSDTPDETAIAMTVIGDSSLSVTTRPNMTNLDGTVNGKQKKSRPLSTECENAANNYKVVMISGGKIADILIDLDKYAAEYGIGQRIPGKTP